jgi:hypothetical protein
MLIPVNKAQIRLGYKILLHYWKDPDKEIFIQSEEDWNEISDLIENFMSIWHLPEPEKLAVSIHRFKKAKKILKQKKKETGRKNLRIMRKYLRKLRKEKPDIIGGF